MNIRSEVSNNVDDEEDGSFGRLHSQITPARVSFNRVICSCLDQKIEYGLGRAEDIARCVGDERENDDDNQKDEGVYLNTVRKFPSVMNYDPYPICKECGFDSSKHCVHGNPQWQQETSRSCRHSSQGINHSRTTSQQHGGNENVRHQTENRESDMCVHAVSSFDNFEKSLKSQLVSF